MSERQIRAEAKKYTLIVLKEIIKVYSESKKAQKVKTKNF
jgi:hypothetical protein